MHFHRSFPNVESTYLILEYQTVPEATSSSRYYRQTNIQRHQPLTGHSSSVLDRAPEATDHRAVPCHLPPGRPVVVWDGTTCTDSRHARSLEIPTLAIWTSSVVLTKKRCPRLMTLGAWVAGALYPEALPASKPPYWAIHVSG